MRLLRLFAAILLSHSVAYAAAFSVTMNALQLLARAVVPVDATPYPPEARTIPQVAVAEVHKAVAQAVKAGDLWLVFGNDSVWQEEPTALQLDATAKVFRRPPALNAIELLPGALKDAWSTETEPKTTVGKLYTELKKAKGNPWPPKAFISTLGEAVGRGLMARVSGSGPLVSLAQCPKMVHRRSLTAVPFPHLIPSTSPP